MVAAVDLAEYLKEETEHSVMSWLLDFLNLPLLNLKKKPITLGLSLLV